MIKSGIILHTLDLHAKNQVRPSVRSLVRVVTHRLTHDAKTITPVASQTRGVKRALPIEKRPNITLKAKFCPETI